MTNGYGMCDVPKYYGHCNNWCPITAHIKKTYFKIICGMVYNDSEYIYPKLYFQYVCIMSHVAFLIVNLHCNDIVIHYLSALFVHLEHTNFDKFF